MKRAILFILSLPSIIQNRIVLKYRNVEFLEYPEIRGRIRIFGWGKLVLGKKVKINSSMSSNPIGGDTQTIITASRNAVVSIGDYTGLSNVTIFCKKKINIGNHVTVGGSVKIYDSDFHSLDFNQRKNPDTDIPAIKSVVLKDNCFIGGHSIILKGVTIGECSIIGAGSVVTKSIPDNEIWGGSPARFIKKIEE